MNRWESIVEELYRREREQSVAEIENQPVTVRFMATHVQMLQALASRFPSESRSSIAASLLESAVEQVFALLPPDDRTALAKEADAAYIAFAKDAYTNFHQAGLGFWAAQDWAYTEGKRLAVEEKDRNHAST